MMQGLRPVGKPEQPTPNVLRQTDGTSGMPSNVKRTEMNGKVSYTVHGNLIISGDMYFDGDLTVEGSILTETDDEDGCYRLKVDGNLTAGHINVPLLDMEVCGLNAWNIHAYLIRIESDRPVNAKDVDVYAILAGTNDINAGKLFASLIYAQSITAFSLETGPEGIVNAADLTVGDVDAAAVVLSGALKQNRDAKLSVNLLVEHLGKPTQKTTGGSRPQDTTD